MKKIIITIVMAVCIFSLSISASAATEKSDGKNMTKVIKNIKKGNMTKAQKYSDRLSVTANEKCVDNMSFKMRNTYQKVLSKLPKTGTPGMGVTYLWDYFYSDIDNDNKAELFLTKGTCYGDVRLYVYRYKNGKAVSLGSVEAIHCSFYAYPKHKGILMMNNASWTGDYSLYRVVLKKGRLRSKYIGKYRMTGTERFHLGCNLS